MKHPCKDCSNSGCGPYHDECEEYQEFKAEMDEVNKNRKREQTHGRNYYAPSHGFKSSQFRSPKK